MTNLSIDPDKCAGCGMCTFTCPNRFELDQKSYKAKVKSDEGLVASATITVGAEERVQIKTAAENCPVQAIHVQE